MIIAVDGPAGAGKSTVCRLLAQRLGFAYLDTGAMYRAVAYVMTRGGVGISEPSEICARLNQLPLRFALEGDQLTVTFQDRRLGEELRRPEVSHLASAFSQLEGVRTFLVEWQRRLAAQGNVVAEGRDTATVVFPDAAVKVFVTADPTTRTRRRLAEYEAKGIVVDFRTLEKEIEDRDRADQERDLAPLRPAEGACILDTSHLRIEEVVSRLAEIVSRKMEGDNPRCGKKK